MRYLRPGETAAGWLTVTLLMTVSCWAVGDLIGDRLHDKLQPARPAPTVSAAPVSPHACLLPLCRIVPAPKPSVSPLPRATPTRAASRSRQDRRSLAGTGSRALSVTAYCWTGNRTASGAWPEIGMAAGNRWPFGTRLRVEDWGVVTITDRIGHGSQLDLYLGRDGCEQRARTFGRRHLRVEVLP